MTGLDRTGSNHCLSLSRALPMCSSPSFWQKPAPWPPASPSLRPGTLFCTSCKPWRNGGRPAVLILGNNPVDWALNWQLSPVACSGLRYGLHVTGNAPPLCFL